MSLGSGPPRQPGSSKLIGHATGGWFLVCYRIHATRRCGDDAFRFRRPLLCLSILHWFPRQFRLNPLRAVRPLDHVLASAARSHERVNQPGGKASTTAILEVLASFRRSAPVPSGRACTSTPTVASSKLDPDDA